MEQRGLFDEIIFEGGEGESLQEAIFIKGARSHADGVAAEYAYLEKRFGRRGVDWNLIGQALLTGPGDQRFDGLEIELASG